MSKIYPYVFDNKIKVSDNSIIQNKYTWEHGEVYHLGIIEQWLEDIKSDSIVLDIGAQSGAYTLSAKFYPKSKWYSFEPDPDNYKLLLENLKLNDINNVITSSEALSNKVGDETLNICSSHRGLNTLGNNLIRFSKDDTIECSVKTNTIDNLFLDTPIDLIKIDTEGSEYDILMGGLETIKKYKPKILLEFEEQNIQQCGHSCQDLLNLIYSLDYELVWRAAHGGDIFIQSRVDSNKNMRYNNSVGFQ